MITSSSHHYGCTHGASEHNYMTSSEVSCIVTRQHKIPSTRTHKAVSLAQDHKLPPHERVDEHGQLLSWCGFAVGLAGGGVDAAALLGHREDGALWCSMDAETARIRAGSTGNRGLEHTGLPKLTPLRNDHWHVAVCKDGPAHTYSAHVPHNSTRPT